MTGVGHGAAAVSILNALFTGTGASAGVELYARAVVDLDASPATGRGSTDPLVQQTFEAALQAWADSPRNATVAVDSHIPIRRGLKSSSAVATAIERATLSAAGQVASPSEIARLGARTARDGGFSATGAFDDAMASIAPGLHVTDNARFEELSSFPMPASLDVVLWVPPGRHAPSPNYRRAFHELRAEAEPARVAALGGEWRRAMELNSELVERAMGYPYRGLRDRLRAAGGEASGVSGMGPALACAVPRDRVASVLRSLPRGEGDVIVTRFLQRTPGEGG